METLARYIGGTLSDDQRERTEAHFALCDECRQDFVVASRLINDEESAECQPIPEADARSLWKQFKDNISKACQWTRAYASELIQQSQLEWAAPALVRGSESPALDYAYLSKNIGDLRTDMFVEKKGDDKVSVKVRVLHENRCAENMRLSLKKKGGRDISRHLRGDYVLFENLSFGTYRLALIQYRMNRTWDYFFEISEAGIDEKDQNWEIGI